MIDIVELNKRIEEEKADAAYYAALAEKAKDSGFEQIIIGIAREELQHAKNLEFILEHIENP